ncbi:hypothetical protein BDN72DRAFT_899188 [Pluteus cervinus]|uniref:Uncharacterized protein n=1 Tax=Pluteus cervinus TaxID=181527 RepID=A0ACD3APG6_9AGAR|nr:hypothetical protein BDN72DRAFT_899188 [Pluteus cervinus]
MTTSPSPSDSRSRTPPSPNGHLPRGKACMNCRRRKIKCDGEKPICGQCSRSRGLFDDCEYATGGKTRTQLLEESLVQLQRRIRELETANETHAASIFLHHPYSPESQLPALLPTYGRDDFASSAGSSASSSPAPMLPMSINMSEEPPFELVQHLVYIFQQSSSRAGWFLHPSRLQDVLMNDLPFGQSPRLCPSLLNGIYLWASRFTPAALSAPHSEQFFLNNALSHLHHDLTGSSPLKILQTIQAEVLLSFYYLDDGKFLEGSFHASAALSICYSSKLHLIRSSQLDCQQMLEEYKLGDLSIGISSATEEGERINAFWTVMRLNSYFLSYNQSPSPFNLPDSGVDTPWPLDITSYDTTRIPSESSETLKKFLEGSSVDGFSAEALYVKASTLVESATSLSSSFSQTRSPNDYQYHFATLDHVIEKFKNNLPLVDALHNDSASRGIILTTRFLSYLATIRLHFPLIDQLEDSRDKCLVAATAILRGGSLLPDPQSTQVDPIMPLVWYSACEVFQKNLASGHPQGRPFIIDMVQSLLNTIILYSPQSYLTQLYLSRAQQLFRGLTPA